MEATEQEKSQVQAVISRVARDQGLDEQEARKLLHRYICGGKCDWYQTKSKAAGFRKGGLTAHEQATLEGAITEVLPGASDEQVWYVVHGVLCPGHPRTRPVEQKQSDSVDPV